jgi:hypothetical protein
MADATTSKSFYYDIDLEKNQLIDAKLQPVTTAERTVLASSYNTADKGIVVFDTTLLLLFVWDGNQWKPVSLSSIEYNNFTEAYNKTLISLAVTSTPTAKTVTATHQDGSTTSATWQDGYIHTQGVAALSWTIIHNLGKYPSINIVDSSNAEVIGEVVYDSLNQLTVTFSAAFSGKAYLN